MDANNGHYADDGYYIAGKKRAAELKSFSKEEIKKNQGKYDDYGFFLLEDQNFYDPIGYYFNDKGFEEVGGYSSTLKKTVKATLNIKKIAKSTMMTIILMANTRAFH